MGLDETLEPENCQAGPRPGAVYALVECPTGGESKTKDKTKNRYYDLNILDGGFTDLSVGVRANSCRRSMPSRLAEVNAIDNEVQRRGSMYHSSREVRKMKKQREVKRNLESVDNKKAFLSFEIVNSLSRPYQYEQVFFPQEKKSAIVSLHAEQKSPSLTTQPVLTEPKDFTELSFRHLPERQPDLNYSSRGTTNSFQDTCLPSRDAKFYCAKVSARVLEQSEEPNNLLGQVLDPEYDGDIIHEKYLDLSLNFPKSFSAKLGTFGSSSYAEKSYFTANTKPRLGPLKKMFDPIMKSKSMRTLPVGEAETPGFATPKPASILKNRDFCKSLLNDFANAAEKEELDEPMIRGDRVLMSESPVHLQGMLELELKHGPPSFEFSIKDPEFLLSATTWKTDNAFSWVYTFHKKKSSGTAWGTKDRHRQSSSMIGQMHVSCYLCSETNDSGYIDNSMLTEFVLYDIAQAKRGSHLGERCHCASDSSQAPCKSSTHSLIASSSMDAYNSMEQEKCKHPVKNSPSDCDAVPSTYPWAPADLHPQLEIAAIEIKIPFGKKDGSKLLQVDEIGNKVCPNLSTTTFDHRRDTVNGPAKLKVVTPSGRHGLPNTEEGSPSSLLDRWRFGGGCDCGGWDMGCPIVVFDNSTGDMVKHPKHGTQKSIVLFNQGRKEKVPALSITADGKGVYSIQFHAQLSALQAFAICIAMLHGAETSMGGEENKLNLFSNSRKVQLQEEVRNLIEAVGKEEKKKPKKTVEQIPSSFLLDPPFSPMGRV